MKNFVQKGDVIDVELSATVSSGDMALIGQQLVVYKKDGESGDTVAAKRVGVFELTKATGEAWTQGDPLYFDEANSELTKTRLASQPHAIAAADAESADTEGDALILPAAQLADNGDIIQVDPGATVAVGDFAMVNGAFGQFLEAGDSGDILDFRVGGILTGAPKATSETWAGGERLYWDSGSSELTTTASTHDQVGVAAEAAGSSDTTGSIRPGILSIAGS